MAVQFVAAEVDRAISGALREAEAPGCGEVLLEVGTHLW
jgi:hypothetical protein